MIDGRFGWYLRSIRRLAHDQRPPAIGASRPEPGLDLPTIHQRGLTPPEDFDKFLARVRNVAHELQVAWTKRDWERARQYETNALFQMHRYWIDELLRQGIRNVVDGYTIDKIEIAKKLSDAFYESITVRLYASGTDRYIRDDGTEIGSASFKRWSEYWTFVRSVAGASETAKYCPNCGGPRASAQTAVCPYCGGKIVSGDFPWILSRIEQDDAYRG